MACLAPIGNLLVWLVITCAAIAILRIILVAISGIGWSWPTVPPGPPQPGPAGGVFARIVGVVIAILDVIFWAIIVIALIWLAIDLIGCLAGFAHFPSLPRFG